MDKLRAQPFYEDVHVGMQITSLEKRPQYTQLFMFSAVMRNIHRIHYDQTYAQFEEHPDVLVQGPLHGAFLAQLMTDWIGDDGILKKLSYSNRGRAVPGDVLTCKGTVTKKYKHAGQHIVECEIWEENQQGQILTPGSATVILPSQHASGIGHQHQSQESAL